MAEGTENPIEAGQFLGDDGVLQEDWRDHFAEQDADLKDDPTLANVKDIRGMARTIVDGQKTIGKLSGGRNFAILPDENSPDEEKEAFYTKVGRPKSAEGYEFDKAVLPDGIPTDDALAAKMSQALFGAGASKGIGDAVKKAYIEYITELSEKMATEDKLANAEANKQLHGVLGSAYDAKMASANLAIEAFARPIDNDFAETLKNELPYDAPAAQFMIKVGELVSEDKGLKENAETTGFTPGDARAKVNEIQANPYYLSEQPADKPRNAALHKQLVEEVARLLKIANA